MRKEPLVSIITPSLNQAQYIEDTIKSVLSQDYPNIEHIIVDGGSSDDTVDMLWRYSSWIKWISEPDRGQADAINKGFRMAKGEILGWLNSDDTYCAGAVKSAVDYFLENPEVFMVYADGYEIDEEGRVIREFPATQKFDLWKLVHIWDYILQPTVFMRRDALFEVGLLDTSLNWCMDWDLWIRFAKRYRVAYVPTFFANSRVYSASKTSSGGFRRLGEIAYVMRKHSRRKYPPGLFVYAQDMLEAEIRSKFPLLYHLVFRYPLYGLRHLCARLVCASLGPASDR